MSSKFNTLKYAITIQTMRNAKYIIRVCSNDIKKTKQTKNLPSDNVMSSI